MKTRKAYVRNIVLLFSFLFLVLLNVATTFTYFGQARAGIDQGPQFFRHPGQKILADHGLILLAAAYGRLADGVALVNAVAEQRRVVQKAHLTGQGQKSAEHIIISWGRG